MSDYEIFCAFVSVMKHVGKIEELNLSKTGSSHIDSHRLTIIAVTDSEFTIFLSPGCNLVGAVLIGEEFNLHILVVGHAGSNGIKEIVGAQCSSLRGNGG